MNTRAPSTSAARKIEPTTILSRRLFRPLFLSPRKMRAQTGLLRDACIGCDHQLSLLLRTHATSVTLTRRARLETKSKKFWKTSAANLKGLTRAHSADWKLFLRGIGWELNRAWNGRSMVLALAYEKAEDESCDVCEHAVSGERGFADESITSRWLLSTICEVSNLYPMQWFGLMISCFSVFWLTARLLCSNVVLLRHHLGWWEDPGELREGHVTCLKMPPVISTASWYTALIWCVSGESLEPLTVPHPCSSQAKFIVVVVERPGTVVAARLCGLAGAGTEAQYRLHVHVLTCSAMTVWWGKSPIQCHVTWSSPSQAQRGKFVTFSLKSEKGFVDHLSKHDRARPAIFIKKVDFLGPGAVRVGLGRKQWGSGILPGREKSPGESARTFGGFFVWSSAPASRRGLARQKIINSVLSLLDRSKFSERTRRVKSKNSPWETFSKPT